MTFEGFALIAAAIPGDSYGGRQRTVRVASVDSGSEATRLPPVQADRRQPGRQRIGPIHARRGYNIHVHLKRRSHRSFHLISSGMN